MSNPYEHNDLTLSPGAWIGFGLLIAGHIALAAWEGLLSPFRRA